MKHILKALIAAFLVYWMIQKGSLQLNLVVQATASGVFAIAAGIILAQITISSQRFRLFLQMQGIEIRLGYLVPLTMISMLFSFIFPGGVGGDVVKAYYLFRDRPHEKLISGTCMLADRMAGFFAMSALAFAGVLLNPHLVSQSRLQPVVWIVAAIFFSFITAAVVARAAGPKFMEWIFAKTGAAFRFDSRLFFSAIGLSLCSQMGTVAFFCFAARILGYEMPLETLLLIVPAGMILVALPISPNGIGIGQAAYDYLFGAMPDGAHLFGVTAITVFQMGNVLWATVGLYFYLFRRS